ncbi:MAG: DUF1080 domain-containing protein [Bacteroidota bacterium]
MKLKSLLLGFGLITLLCACNDTNQQEQATDEPDQTESMQEEAPAALNTLTAAEKEDGWQLLFDGKSAEGWRNYGKETFPEGWQIVDGMIHCPGSGRGEAGGKDRGDILYGDKQFGNFHLKLEWKISEGGNSGIFYLGQESDDYDYIWKTAPEMQVLDNINHPDAKAGIAGNRQAGSLYDLIPADPQNARPVGEWNEVEIKVYKGSVWHIMNGETVLEYHLWTPEWNELVAGSKFPALNENWADVASEGYIGLQDHGDDVWYRNIKIKEL